MKGVLFFHSETGTEGGYWAFQDSDYISPDSGMWAYEGLHLLKNGDRLKIYSKHDTCVIWEGAIALIEYPPFTQEANGFWIHADQLGEDREDWAGFFFNQYPAELEKS